MTDGYKIKRELIRVNGVEKQIRPPIKPRTFTITWTEKSDMSSGWTYSDDATGLTAGDTAFDDFFGYSAVLLGTDGTENSEMKQSGGVFTDTMTNFIGNSTDNVMIKFPIRGIKMSKSGSVVTLSITDEKNKDGYQYYAFQTGQTNNITDTKDKFYIGAYKGYNSPFQSKSGVGWMGNRTQPNFCTYAKNNGDRYNIVGFYQRAYINALYMMKYGNPDNQTVIGVGASSKVITGGTNNQTSATYGTSSTSDQIKLFGLEDWWGNGGLEWVGGAYNDSSNILYTQLSGYSGYSSGGVTTGTTLASYTYQGLSGIAGNNKAMFAGTTTQSSSTSYYKASVDNYSYQAPHLMWVGYGLLGYSLSYGTSNTHSSLGARLMYL